MGQWNIRSKVRTEFIQIKFTFRVPNLLLFLGRGGQRSRNGPGGPVDWGRKLALTVIRKCGLNFLGRSDGYRRGNTKVLPSSLMMLVDFEEVILYGDGQ